jgi:hypothetical protein
MHNNLVPNEEFKFICNCCDYKTIRKSQFDRHLLTLKHKNKENTTKIQHNTTEKRSYNCECGKKYLHRASLYNHKKKCNNGNEINKELKDSKISSELILKLINENNEFKNTILKENQELRNQITELIPKVGSNNNNRNKFNINIFLNEKCKDALSMDQFIDKIEVSIKDLITTRDKGQPEGISNIIIENMKKLSLYERPVHCTDKKRETLYIKTDEWEKDHDKELINDALKKIESKQLKNVKKWMEKHPNYMNNQKEQEEFLKLINETSKSDERNREKVIKNICNTTYLDK